MRHTLFMNRILLIIFVLLLQACTNEKKESSKLERSTWLLGYWEMRSPGGSSVTESWVRIDDTSFAGAGKFMDSSGNVVSSEEIRIVLRDGKLCYIPIVDNQNDGEAITFTEADHSDSIMVFENKEHDFPQRIVYTRIGNDSMLAYIEGDVDGETRRIEFPYRKQ